MNNAVGPFKNNPATTENNFLDSIMADRLNVLALCFQNRKRGLMDRVKMDKLLYGLLHGMAKL